MKDDLLFESISEELSEGQLHQMASVWVDRRKDIYY